MNENKFNINITSVGGFYLPYDACIQEIISEVVKNHHFCFNMAACSWA